MTKQRQILDGLAFALQNSDSRIQASLLTEIVDYLPPDVKEEVLQTALVATESISWELERLEALNDLACKLPPELLPEALAIGKALTSGVWFVDVLEGLVPLLPPDLLLEALDMARDLSSNEYDKAMALSTLADKLPEKLQTEVVLEALVAAESYPSDDKYLDEMYCSHVFTAIFGILPEVLQTEKLQKTLDYARAVKDHCDRSISLADLALKLPEKLQAEVLKEALDAVKEERKLWGEEADDSVKSALVCLIPKLPPDLLPEALTIARDIRFEPYRAKALIAITAKLPELLLETFALVKSIKFTYSDGRLPEVYRFQTLIAIAPNLSSELLPEAFSIAKDIQSKLYRIKVLIALADPMSKMPRDELLPLWKTIRHWLSRQELAHHVLALAAVIHAIGGQEAVVEALIKIQDVERWQP